MNFPKKTLLVVSISLSALIIGYIARVSIINNISKTELALYQAKITCLDFHLSSDLALTISALCIETPQARVDIHDMVINTELTSDQKIKAVDIASVHVDGKAELVPYLIDLQKNTEQKSSQLPASQQLKTALAQLAQFGLPFDIAVKQLCYTPHQVIDSSKSPVLKHSEIDKSSLPSRYFGHFLANNSQFEMQLQDHQQQTLFAATFSKNEQTTQENFSLELSAQLSLLAELIDQHNIALPLAIKELTQTIETHGELYSLINYQYSKLTLNSQLSAFSLETDTGVKASGPFKLSGALGINGEINFSANSTEDKNDAQLALSFTDSTALTLHYSQPHLLALLKQNDIAPEVVTVLKENPINQLSLSPGGDFLYRFKTQQLTLSSLNVTAKNIVNVTLSSAPVNSQVNDQVNNQATNPATELGKNIHNTEPAHQLNLSNIVLDLHQFITPNHKSAKLADHYVTAKNVILAELDFMLNSSLQLSAISSLSSEAVGIMLLGSIRQAQNETLIKISENSFLSSNNIAILSAQSAGNKKRLSIKNIKNYLQGDIKLQDQQAIRLDLSIDSVAHKLQVPKYLNINKLTLNSKITGNIDNISITTLASADEVPLGQLAISGTAEKPHITLSAKALPLTDLLSLNLQLPVKVALVDGTLSYSVAGQVSDLSNIANTPLLISLGLTSVSGEVEDIWLQELNWQQSFNYSAGKLTTHSGVDENLTIALIDTPTPIAKLSITTGLSYQEDFKITASQLKGDILGGSFAIPSIQWPLEHKHSVDVQLTSIDLEQVLALDKKQGIVVTGNVSGQLPIIFDGEKYTMEKGELHNVTQGLIQVMNNPAVEELKANNSQLQLAFDALQNLHYHQLSSDVSMADDGYMLLATVIKGRNPDIDNDVNLNLNLSYDLLGLLESMSITEQFEERIIKGLQKH